MDLRQQIIERILKLEEKDLRKVIAYLEEHRESVLNLQVQSQGGS